MGRLGADVLGKEVANHDITEGLTVAEPQSFQRTRPRGPPRQLHVVEDFEEVHRLNLVHPRNDGVDAVDGFGHIRLGDIVGTAEGFGIELAGEQRAVGIERPVRTSDAVLTTVDLEGPSSPAPRADVERLECHLHFPRSLLGQNDRLIEKDVLHPGRRAHGRQRHGRVRGTGDDDAAVNHMMGQPRLGFHRQLGGVHRVAGGQFFDAAQDSRHRRGAVERRSRVLRPEAAMLERIGGQLHPSGGTAVAGAEVGPVAADEGPGERLRDLASITDTLAQRHDRSRCRQVFGPHLNGGARQYRLGADFHQHRAAQFGDGAHAFGELHRIARMPPPVAGIEDSIGR